METNDNLSQQVRECADRISESGAVALAALYDLTAPRLVRFAVTLTRNQHDAEDALQAVLVRVAGRPKLLSAAERPWPYLLRMVRNEALVIIRNRKRALTISSLCDLLTRRSVDEVELEETHRAVWVALRKLPTDQSEVVVLKIWEELTFAQIAEVLDITQSTAASRYRYAMTKLLRHFTKKESGVYHA